MSLRNANVFVIGGTSGIGLEVARAAAAAGSRVTAAGRSPERVRAAQESLGDTVAVRTLDMVDESAVRSFFADAISIDHLVVTATAGSLRFGKVVETSMGQIRSVLDGRFWGTYNIVRYAAPLMPPTGSITLFSGGLAVKSRPGSSVISAAVAAIEALSRTLALELAPIRVNTVRPGSVDTPLLRAAIPNFDEFAKTAGASLPAGRIGVPADIAQGVLFLMSNGFATGTTLGIDGGSLIS
jgi:NAD(P)-dependent dehydrogenase (short-subunit alcohol dehydrogenase family)